MSEPREPQPVQLELPLPDPYEAPCDCDRCKHTAIEDTTGRCGAKDCIICDPEPRSWDIGGEG